MLRTGAILVYRRCFLAFDYNPVFKVNLPLLIHIERTIPLYCIFRRYFEIDNVFATIDTESRGDVFVVRTSKPVENLRV